MSAEPLLPRPPNRFAIVGLILLLAAPSFLQAQQEPPPPPPEEGAGAAAEPPAAGDPASSPDQASGMAGADLHPHGFRQIGLDTRYLFTRPFHLDRTGWLKVAATFGTVAILYIDRVAIRDQVQGSRTPGRDSFLQNPRMMGKGAFAPSLALISYGSSFITHDDREKETAVLLLESMAFTGVFVGVGQFVLSSERPDEGTDVHFFKWGGHGVSGDAALAASVVPVLRNQYLRVTPEDGGGMRFWKRSATGLLYTGAFLTAYQRMNNDKHWAPDVFLGLVTGFTVGQILCDSHDRVREEAGSHASMIAIPGGVGVKWTF